MHFYAYSHFYQANNKSLKKGQFIKKYCEKAEKIHCATKMRPIKVTEKISKGLENVYLPIRFSKLGQLSDIFLKICCQTPIV